jgi:hypothetical protein
VNDKLLSITEEASDYDDDHEEECDALEEPLKMPIIEAETRAKEEFNRHFKARLMAMPHPPKAVVALSGRKYCLINVDRSE